MKNKGRRIHLVWIICASLIANCISLPGMASASVSKAAQTVKVSEMTLPTGGLEKIETYEVTDDEAIEKVPCYYNGISTYSDTQEQNIFQQGTGNYGCKSLTEDAQKNFYNLLETSLTNFNANADAQFEKISSGYTPFKVELGNIDISIEAVKQVWIAFKADHPWLFWLNGYAYTTLGDSLSQFMPTIVDEYIKEEDITDDGYTTSVQGIKDLYEIIQNNVQEYIDAVSVTNDTYEKVRIIHDKIVDNVNYAYKADGKTPEDANWAHSVIGVLDSNHNTVVCEGYAKTFSFILNILDIPNVYIVGDAGGAHAWNAVSFDGGNTYYYVDATWDDQGGKNATIENTYIYFAMPKDKFEERHIPDTTSGNGFDWQYDMPNLGNDMDKTYFKKYSAYATDDMVSDVASATKFLESAKELAPGETCLMLLGDNAIKSVASALGVSEYSYTSVNEYSMKLYATPSGKTPGTPTAAPTGTPTATPTGTPTTTPTGTPTAIPTGTPTAIPTGTPTNAPTTGTTSAPLKDYAVTLDTGAVKNATVTVTKDGKAFKSGDNININDKLQIVITPDTNYVFSDNPVVTADNALIGAASSKDGKYIFTVHTIKDATKIIVSCTALEKQFTITLPDSVAKSIEHATAKLDFNAVAANSTAKLTITPEQGFSITSAEASVKENTCNVSNAEKIANGAYVITFNKFTANTEINSLVVKTEAVEVVESGTSTETNIGEANLSKTEFKNIQDNIKDDTKTAFNDVANTKITNDTDEETKKAVENAKKAVKAIDDGTAFIEVSLVVNEKTNGITDEVEKKESDSKTESIKEETLKNNNNATVEVKTAMMLDISLFSVCKNKTDKKEIAKTSVNELGEPVKISMKLPDNIPAVKSGTTRTYYILCIHKNKDGKVETTVIKCYYIDGILSFDASQFSTYVLCYTDVTPITNNKPVISEGGSSVVLGSSISGGGSSSVISPATATPTIVPTATPTATSTPVPTTTPVATSTPAPTATPVVMPTAVPSKTATPDATPTVVPSVKNQIKKVKAVKKKVTVKKNKKLDVNFKVTATDNKKAVQNKVKATIKNKKIAKVVKTKVKAGKAIVTVKGLKKGKTILKLNIGGKTAKTTIRIK